jgi:hypothetical protein
MMKPPPRIREFEVHTGPVRSIFSSSHIAADGPNDSHNDLWTKLLQCSTKTDLAHKTSVLTRLSLHVVDGLSTQINQIAIQGSKRFEKVSFR